MKDTGTIPTYPTMARRKKQQRGADFLRLAAICLLYLSVRSARRHQRQRHIRPEQVCVDGQPERAAHQLHKAPRNGKPQPAAFRVAGGIPPHEALHQLVGGDVQLGAGYILEAHGHLPVCRDAGHIDPRLRHGVFADVGHQIVHDPAEQLAVGQHHGLPRRRLGHQRQMAVRQPILILAGDLAEQHTHIRGLQIHRQRAGGRLGRLHQILCQLFQPLALPVQHGDILPGGGGGDVLLFQQIHVVDDGCQRRFDVVGHVGDQLGFHPFGAHLLLHGAFHAALQPVHGLPVPPEGAEQPLGVHRRGQVALRQLLAVFLQRPQVQGDGQNSQQLHELQHQKILSVVIHLIQSDLQQRQTQPHQRRFPHQRDAGDDAPQPQGHAPQDAPQQPQYPGGQGAADDGAGLALGGKDAQEQQRDRYQRCTEKDPPPLRIEGVPSDEEGA